jgi:hypothetical protein
VKLFVTFDKATGRILGEGICSKDGDLELQASDTAGVIESAPLDPTNIYVAGATATARPACPITGAAAARVVTLSGVPLGAVIRISGEATETITQSDPSGVLEVTLPAAGAYRFAADVFPAIDYAQDFEVA